MNLRTLIPDASQLQGPLATVLGDDASGLVGLANRIEGQDLGSAAQRLLDRIPDELARALPVAGAEPFAAAVSALRGLSQSTLAPPGELFSSLDRPLQDVSRVVSRFPEIAGQLRTAADTIATLRSGDVASVVAAVREALARVVASADADLAGFERWRAYLVELGEGIRPLIDAGGTPDEIRQRLLDLALARIRDAIRSIAPELRALLDGAQDFLDGLLPDVPGLGLDASRDQVVAHIDAVRSAAEADAPELPQRIEEYGIALRELSDRFATALDTLEDVLEHRLLTPGALTETFDSELQRVSAIRQDRFDDVQARVESMFEKLEQSVDQIDLSTIHDTIGGFFARVGEAFAPLDGAALQREVQDLAAGLDTAVGQVEQTLVALTAQVQSWLAEATRGIEESISELGQHGPDGFEFAFEAELQQLLGKVESLVLGDPDRPGAFSLDSTFREFQRSVTGLIDALESELVAAADGLVAGRDQVAAALEGVRAQIEAVDPSSILTQANSALQTSVDALGAIDFRVLVDPVVEALESARDDLAAIDPESLNELLREALAVALQVVTSIDFEADIERSLLTEFDDLLARPRAVLATIGAKVKAFQERTVALSPAALLEPLRGELERITRGLQLDVAPLLAPLDDAVTTLRAGLDRLDPARFLEPLRGAFDELVAMLDRLQPSSLLEPVQQKIDQLAGAVGGLDLEPVLGAGNAVFGDVDRFLAELDPAALLAPLDEPFAVLRRAVEPLRPSVLLEPVATVVDQLRGFADDLGDALLAQVRAVYDEALQRIESLDPSAVLADIGALVRSLRQRLGQIEPAAALLVLQRAHTATRVALTASDGRTMGSATVEFDLLAPGIELGRIVGRYERLVRRLHAVLQGLDPAPLQRSYATARAKLEELLPLAIRDDITAGRLRTLIELTDPDRWIARLDTIFDRLLDKVDQLSPSHLLAPLTDGYDAVRTAIAGLDPRALTDGIRDAVDRAERLLGSISLAEVVAPITGLVDRLRALVRGLDPGPLIDELRGTFETALQVFDRIDLQPLIDELQTLVDRLRERLLELFDLDALGAPLAAVFESIQGLLGGLETDALFDGIDAFLAGLRSQLEEALERTATAFRGMLAAIPSGVGNGVAVSGGLS